MSLTVRTKTAMSERARHAPTGRGVTKLSLVIEAATLKASRLVRTKSARAYVDVELRGPEIQECVLLFSYETPLKRMRMREQDLTRAEPDSRGTRYIRARMQLQKCRMQGLSATLLLDIR